MRRKIADAIVEEFKDGKFPGFDELKSIIRIALNISKDNWTEEEFQWIVEDVMYQFHGM